MTAAFTMDPDIAPPLLACARGEIAPNVALARLLAAAESRDDADAAIREARQRLDSDLPASTRLGVLAKLWRETPEAWAMVRGVLAEAEAQGGNDARQWASVFDAAAKVSPGAAAAVYCLGREDLLAAATASITGRLDEWGLIGPETHVLDLGCGPGRLAAALAPQVASVSGLDISHAMIEAARRRCAGMDNVRLAATHGDDLAAISDDSIDLVLAVDVFPYLVSAPGLAEAHVAECRRVLRPEGSLLILNFSYRGADAPDEEEATGLASRYGFNVVRVASGDFARWDGRTYHLRRFG